MSQEKGLLIVHTGNGKGKTTAALGLAFRAWGGGAKVLMLQFIKGGQSYGEINAIEKIAAIKGEGTGKLVLKQCGLGFVQENAEKEAHKKAAQAALAEARAALSEDWDMIILDEINYAVTYDLIAKDDLLDLVKKRPDRLHLVLTGRNALPEIIAQADLVTEMTEIKHPYTKGIVAQKWIEF